ncbi:hypothetical protein VTO73DRAFT_9965 [Trametes versicolor]
MHFIAFIIDATTSCVQFGDPMGVSAPSHVRLAFTWWFEQMGDMGGEQKLTISKLPIATQHDTHSCAILSLNALMHHYTNGDTPLILPTKGAVATERMRSAYQVLTSQLQIIEEGGPAVFGDGLMDDYGFTFTATSSSSTANDDQASEMLSEVTRDVPSLLLEDSVESEAKFEIPEMSSCWESSSSRGSDVGSVYDSSKEEEDGSVSGESEIASSASAAESPVRVPSKCRRSLPGDISLDDDAPKTFMDTFMDRLLLGKKAMQAPPTSTQTSLLSFYKMETPDERQERLRREALRDVEVREAMQEQERLREERAKAAKRKSARERQRKSRQRRKEEKQRSRDASDVGRSSKIQRLREVDDVSSSSVSTTIAVRQASRPYRDFKLLQRDGREQTRPRHAGPQQAVQQTNWQAPHLWAWIDEAAREVGRPWSPHEIVMRLRWKSPHVFNALAPQRISEWRDRSVTDKLTWKESVLKRVGRAYRQGFDNTRKGVLHAYPETVKEIVQQLRDLRDTSVALDITVIRGIMVAVITHRAPAVFEQTDKHGQHFKCPEIFVHRFLKKHLGWSIRRCTRAGHKFPVDVDDVCRRFFLCNAVTIRDEDIIHPCFIVNSDQTQVLYSAGGKLTWAPKGSSQVSVAGADEKRAFTLMVGVCLNGEALPFQAIYQGSDLKKSLPRADTRGHADADTAGFRFELSRTRTYWSTFGTMKTYVIFILGPYFDKWREFHGRPMQKCIWNIDVWSVHRSEEFRTWMKDEYAWIIVIYVPGGCTPLLQACDVGIQKLLKLAIKKSAHTDVVEETLEQLKKGVAPQEVHMKKNIGIVRDRSVQWVVNGFKAINKESIIKKAFRLCEAGTFNMSFESLTSLKAKQALNELKKSDPAFYAEITSGHCDNTTALTPSGPDGTKAAHRFRFRSSRFRYLVTRSQVPGTGPDHLWINLCAALDGTFAEDIEDLAAIEDDSATPLAVASATLLEARSARELLKGEDDKYSDSDADVEVPGDQEDPETSTSTIEGQREEIAPRDAGKRIRVPNKRAIKTYQMRCVSVIGRYLARILSRRHARDTPRIGLTTRFERDLARANLSSGCDVMPAPPRGQACTIYFEQMATRSQGRAVR